MLPPVAARGSLYTDSVWIKDANLLEAARRGADEIWLVWCIGNTSVYRRGMLNQYVHMIELSANGSVAEELERIEEAPGPAPRPPRRQAGVPDPARPRLLRRAHQRALADRDGLPRRAALPRHAHRGRPPARLDGDEDARPRPGGRLRRALAWRRAPARRPGRDPGPRRVRVGGTAAFPAAGWIAAPERAVAHGTYDGSDYALGFAVDGRRHELAIERTGRRSARATMRVDGAVVSETPLRRGGLVRRVHATSSDTVAERLSAVAGFLRGSRRRRAATR